MGHRYIGSKTKIIDDVMHEIKQIAPSGSHVVDLMTGTAAVASALRGAGYKVTAADVMTYSFHHARVALLLCAEPSFKNAGDYIKAHSDEKDIDSKSNYHRILQILNDTLPIDGYFWNEFSASGNPKNASKPRNYFSPENASKIDAIRQRIKSMHNDGLLSDIEYSLLLHDLIMATNDVANISGTYGHYMAKLNGRALTPILLKPSKFDVSNSNIDNIVLKGYAEDLSNKISCDLCYIDPPYMKRQYAANYHILETLAREDSPEAIGESGLRPWRDQYSNFCTKTKIRGSFAKIFNEMKCKDFLISYSEDGLLSIEDLTSFFAEFGKVTVKTIDHKRFKSNQSKLHNKITEYLIHLRKD